MRTPGLRTAAVWSAVALSTAHAQYVIDNLSFGHKDGQPISPNLRGIPHFHIAGEGYTPELLSDRVILTPPYPGHVRGALWSEDPLHHAGDWTAELHFRASGQDYGAGNLQLWYTKEPQKNEAHSLYSAPKFDGLVLVVDQYEGRGGSVRGFLNDGSTDIKAHPNSDTLSFGQCNFPYRNLGRFVPLKLHHANGVFEVTIDGHPCFSTDKVRLPDGYFFGITASSSENPDSFEVSKFAVSTTNSYTREEPNMARKQPPTQQNQQNQQQQAPMGGHRQEESRQFRDSHHDIPQMLSDVLAGTIRSQEDQFADLHNRIQIMNHRVNEIYDMLHENSKKLEAIVAKVAPLDDRSAAQMRTLGEVERTAKEVQRDLNSKDYKDMLRAVHNAIQNSHDSLSEGMPAAMAQIAGKSGPSIWKILFIFIAVQGVVVVGYKAYEKRRAGNHQKYL